MALLRPQSKAETEKKNVATAANAAEELRRLRSRSWGRRAVVGVGGEVAREEMNIARGAPVRRDDKG